MSQSYNTQWLVFGWPLDYDGQPREEVNARLYRFSDDGSYTMVDGQIPLSVVGLERIGDFEIAPGLLALHQTSSARRAEFLDHLSTDNSQQTKTRNPEPSLYQVKRHSSWCFTEYALLLSRIQHASRGLGISQTRSQRVITDWETAREICYRTATYFGPHVIRNATILYERENPDFHHQTLRITFESPVDGPSLLHGTIERDIEGVITLSLWYRFSTSSLWHQFCLCDFDDIGEIMVTEHMRAVITELIRFTEHGCTRDEIISHLGRIYDLADSSSVSWAESQIAASDAVENQTESSLPKVKKMLFE